MGLLDQVKIVSREKTYARVLLSGMPSSGKTYSAIMLANALTSDQSKILFIDTENRGSLAYEKLGVRFSILNLTAPYAPKKLYEIVLEAIKLGYETIIVDSFTSFYEDAGGMLEIVKEARKETKNEFHAWNEAVIELKKFICAIRHASVNIIFTSRVKTETVEDVITSKSGKKKTVMKKIAGGDKLKDADYEVMTALRMNENPRNFEVTKDDSGIFRNSDGIFTNELCNTFAKWCENAESPNLVRLGKLRNIFMRYASQERVARYNEFEYKTSDTQKRVSALDTACKAIKSDASRIYALSHSDAEDAPTHLTEFMDSIKQMYSLTFFETKPETVISQVNECDNV